ncbi:MAG: DNA-directed RNA polymerase subunit P [Thermoprotei archaeon]|nr:MAG: DNA-directed RNA polymerase subunit P [Thermoprotei archaeon]RLF18803.1 MAG: DNA-directed RNA polymerase subunit P [Thermoprotei archaeon]
MVTYVCGRCGNKFTREELELIPSIMCPYCGYRIIFKSRPQVAKRVKAE